MTSRFCDSSSATSTLYVELLLDSPNVHSRVRPRDGPGSGPFGAKRPKLRASASTGWANCFEMLWEYSGEFLRLQVARSASMLAVLIPLVSPAHLP